MLPLYRLIFALSLFFAAPAFAAPVAFYPSLPQGFSAQKPTQESFGYISSLTIAGKVLPADLAVTTPSGTGAAVGVLARWEWAGGSADPISLDAAISSANRATLASLLARGLTSRNVSIQFVVYSYDPIAKKWFPALQNLTVPLSALVGTSGRTVSLQVGTTPNSSVLSPQNYPMSVTLVPAPVAQGIRLGSSANPDGSPVAIVKPWGVSL